jgi:MYXO-CTERM domain-containing protein
MASFPIAATASDDHSVTRVELWIDGAMVTSKTSAPFSFTAPAGLAAGAHTIMARAVDSANQTKDASISVNLAQNPPSGCTSNSQCQTGYECSGGQCVMIPQPGQPDAGMPPTGDGQLGTPCADNSQCLSGICGTGPDGMRCTQICTPGGSDCPVGFDCLQAGNQGACWPSGNSNPTDPGNGTNSGGCSAGGAASAAPLGVVAMLGLALLARRRPGRARAKSR